MKPILVDLPEKIETARLLMRAPKAGDGKAINAAIVESINELRPWMPWASPPPSAADTEEWARNAHASYARREILPLTIWDRESGAFIGNSGLHDIDWDVPAFEIGYWLRTSAATKGYMTEAVNGITEFCARKLHARRMQIRMEDGNERSWRIAERCGYTLEGISRNSKRNHLGVLVDMRTYTKVFDEQGEVQHARHH